MIAAGFIERSLNHLLQQSPGATEALLHHAGCSVRFDLTLDRFDFRIADDGCFTEAVTDTPDAVIKPTAAHATAAAAAARWCVEQGYLEEDFAPEKYVPKYKVIRILKQAKSAT